MDSPLSTSARYWLEAAANSYGSILYWCPSKEFNQLYKRGFVTLENRITPAGKAALTGGEK